MKKTFLTHTRYRYGNEWKFKALGDGRQGGLRGMGAEFGIALA